MKLRQYFVKLKISKSFNTGKWDRCIEYFARLFVLASVIVLAMWTIFTSPLGVTLFAKVLLGIFIAATLIVFYFEARHLSRRQPSNLQESTGRPAYTELPGRNRLISIGLIALVAIILVPIFAKQRLPDPQEYQAFLTAFAGVGAWVIGIALVVFTYQQYKLRETEHRLLFTPQILLSGSSPKIGPGVYNNQKYTYRIEWSVFILNLSQIPILIRYMQVRVKLAGEDSSREGLISPTHCHVVEPENLSEQFEVTLTKPCYITWIVEGPSAGDVFDYVSGDSGKRDFVLAFRVIAKRPQDPDESIFLKETVSWPIYVPKDAKWATPTPFTV